MSQKKYELERVRQKPLSRAEFRARLVRFALVALAIALIALAIGMVGYHELEGLSWTDSYLNAAMILSGMGQVDPLEHRVRQNFRRHLCAFLRHRFPGR